MAQFPDIGVEQSGFVATIEIQRPPHNFFDNVLINSIADALEALDQDDYCRAVVLAAQGKSFCAGANFGDGSTLNKEGQRPGEAMAPIGHLYIQAVRLFRSKKPIVGAIHGAAVGGGLGLAMVPDFRVACPETRFVRELHAARLPSGLRPDRDAARRDRPAERRDDVLHEPPRHRRGSARHGPRRRAGAAGSGARRGAKARRRDRRERAARHRSRRAPPCAPASPTAS